MKKLLLFALLFVLAISSAMALSIGTVQLGSENQQRGAFVSRQLTLVNNGDQDLTDLAVSFSANARYRLNATLDQTELAVNETTTVTVTGFVPLDLDAVDSNGKKINIDIGDMQISGTNEDSNTVSTTSNVLMEAENNLRFGSDTEIVIDGRRRDLDDGDDFTAKRGDDVTITVEVENRFDNDGDCNDLDDYGDCTIEDVVVEIDSDRDLDWEDDFDIGDLDADDTDSDSFSFTIDSDVDDGKYDAEIWVTGDDENGARHGEYLTFEIEVDVPRDEVLIDNFNLNPSTLSCGERRTTLSVTLENSGRDDQDRASIFLESSRLDIKDSVYNIDIEEGETVTRSFSITVPPNLNPGQYFIQIIANVDNSDETDRDAATLVVTECRDDDDDTPVVDDDKNPPSTDGETIQIIEIPPTSGVIYGQENQQEGVDNYTLLLIGMVILAVLLIFVLLAVLLK